MAQSCSSFFCSFFSVGIAASNLANQVAKGISSGGGKDVDVEDDDDDGVISWRPRRCEAETEEDDAVCIGGGVPGGECGAAESREMTEEAAGDCGGGGEDMEVGLERRMTTLLLLLLLFVMGVVVVPITSLLS